MVYGLLRALPGDHACLTPSPALLIADLTPTIGASEPHDLAVRVGSVRYTRRSVHRIPPRVDDVAQRPSVGRDGRGYIADLGLLASEISEIQKLLVRARETDKFGIQR